MTQIADKPGRLPSRRQTAIDKLVIAYNRIAHNAEVLKIAQTAAINSRTDLSERQKQERLAAVNAEHVSTLTMAYNNYRKSLAVLTSNL